MVNKMWNLALIKRYFLIEKKPKIVNKLIFIKYVKVNKHAGLRPRAFFYCASGSDKSFWIQYFFFGAS